MLQFFLTDLNMTVFHNEMVLSPASVQANVFKLFVKGIFVLIIHCDVFTVKLFDLV